MKHLLIDFENIQPKSLTGISETDTKIWLFMGKNQINLPLELVKALWQFQRENVHIININTTGSNALDFVLSYQLGKIINQDHEADIIILSKDTGYDAVINHIKHHEPQINITRLVTLDNLPILIENTSSKISTSLSPFFEKALWALRTPNGFKPKLLNNLKKYLRNHVLQELFSEQTEEQQQQTIQAITNKLKNQHFIKINEQEQITYYLSDVDMWKKVKTFVLSSQPKTIEALKERIFTRCQALCLEINENIAKEFIHFLCQENIIRQQGDKIEYSPFKNKLTAAHQPQKIELENQEDWQKKALKIVDKTRPNRPKTQSALLNSLKSAAKQNESEANQWLQWLQDNQYIKIENDKIQYLK